MQNALIEEIRRITQKLISDANDATLSKHWAHYSFKIIGFQQYTVRPKKLGNRRRQLTYVNMMLQSN